MLKTNTGDNSAGTENSQAASDGGYMQFGRAGRLFARNPGILESTTAGIRGGSPAETAIRNVWCFIPHHVRKYLKHVIKTHLD